MVVLYLKLVLTYNIPNNFFSSGFVSATEYTGHTGYVTSICAVFPDNNWPNGLIITGSRDSTILVYLPNQPTAIKQLTGHTDTGV